MNLKKFEVTLKKINTLKETIDLSGEDISRLEIELLQNYVKRLYESITFEEDELFEVEEIPKKKKKKKSKFKAVENTSVKELDEEEETIVSVEGIENDPEVQQEEIGVPPPKAYDEALMALFEFSNASELSEKLSRRPITDMKKAMGINEKIFTVNEMFGGDKQLFDSTMDKLNSFSSFEEAKTFLLEHVAEKFEWSKPDNHKKVKMFIKLVQRRYV